MFNVTKEEKKVGNIVVLYGAGGIGKSTIIAQAIKEVGDKGLLVSVGEDGISPLQKDTSFADLTGINRVDATIKKWSDPNGGLVELMYWLAEQDYEAVAFDSLSMIMGALEDYCFKKYYLDDPDAHGKNPDGSTKNEEDLRRKAYGFAKSELLAYEEQEWRRFIGGAQFLRDKGVDVYISCHTATKKGRILGEDLEFDYADLDMPQNKNVSLSTDLYNCSDLFLYGKKDHTLAKTKQKGKGKLVGSGDRVLVCDSDILKVKNRKNMPDMIPAEYEELKKYL